MRLLGQNDWSVSNWNVFWELGTHRICHSYIKTTDIMLHYSSKIIIVCFVWLSQEIDSNVKATWNTFRNCKMYLFDLIGL